MPVVVGRSVESARVALQSVPLAADVVYVPAKPRTRPGQVVRQKPRGGFLSANGSVRLWVSTAKNGLVPNLVGSSLQDARERSRKLRLELRIRYGDGPAGTVVEQSLEPGIAVRPGCRSRCSSGATRPASPGLDVPPRQLCRARDADARCLLDAGYRRRRRENERRG